MLTGCTRAPKYLGYSEKPVSTPSAVVGLSHCPSHHMVAGGWRVGYGGVVQCIVQENDSCVTGASGDW